MLLDGTMEYKIEYDQNTYSYFAYVKIDGKYVHLSTFVDGLRGVYDFSNEADLHTFNGCGKTEQVAKQKMKLFIKILADIDSGKIPKMAAKEFLEEGTLEEFVFFENI